MVAGSIWCWTTKQSSVTFTKFSFTGEEIHVVHSWRMRIANRWQKLTVKPTMERKIDRRCPSKQWKATDGWKLWSEENRRRRPALSPLKQQTLSHYLAHSVGKREIERQVCEKDSERERSRLRTESAECPLLSSSTDGHTEWGKEDDDGDGEARRAAG